MVEGYSFLRRGGHTRVDPIDECQGEANPIRSTYALHRGC